MQNKSQSTKLKSRRRNNGGSLPEMIEIASSARLNNHNSWESVYSQWRHATNRADLGGVACARCLERRFLLLDAPRAETGG